MPHEQLLALELLAFVGCFTPGPNNVIATVTGANHGFAPRCHTCWRVIRIATMLIAGSAGVAALLLTYPYIAASIKWAGFAFLLFIAWQLAPSHPHVTRVAGHLKCTTEGRNRGVQNTPLLGYIGTEIAYIQSGYRSSPACRWSIRKPNRR